MLVGVWGVAGERGCAGCASSCTACQVQMCDERGALQVYVLPSRNVCAASFVESFILGCGRCPGGGGVGQQAPRLWLASKQARLPAGRPSCACVAAATGACLPSCTRTQVLAAKRVT